MCLIVNAKIVFLIPISDAIVVVTHEMLHALVAAFDATYAMLCAVVSKPATSSRATSDLSCSRLSGLPTRGLNPII
eukprot:1137247-Pelagomonas_calceolata.AAC.3